MSEPKKIIFVITGLGIGGAELMLYRLLIQIKSTVNPIVVSLLPPGPVGELLTKSGIEVRSINLSKSYLSILIGFYELILLIRQTNPSVVHTWMYHADLFGGLAAKLCRVPKIIWCVRHANISPSLNSLRTVSVAKACAWLSRWIPQKIVFASKRGQDIHEKFGYCKSKSLTILNGFDFSKFKPASMEEKEEFRNQLGIPNEYKLIGLVARFDPVKNHEGFIEVASYVAAQCPKTHFVMVGRGVTESNNCLLEPIGSRGLNGRFSLLGERDDIPEIMRCLDVLCLTSHSESFPNVLAEAMASGTVCVSTDVGDAPEILGNYGFISPIGDMRSLAEQAVKLIEMSHEQINQFRENGRNYALERFEISKISEQYKNLYLE